MRLLGDVGSAGVSLKEGEQDHEHEQEQEHEQEDGIRSTMNSTNNSMKSQDGHASIYTHQSRAPPPSNDLTTWERNRRFGIVIDAGSSGSRLQIYSWLDHSFVNKQRLANGQSIAVLPKIEKGVREGDAWTMKVEPGISSLADRPAEEVANYLSPLFKHAETIIPPSQISTTPVYILATAGMRLLTDSQSDAILTHACTYLQSSHSTPFSVKSCPDQIRIITGEEEGIYGWIAINYLMDGFDSHGLSSKGVTQHSSTFGFLDMGGASTQLAFEPSEEARKQHKDNLLSVNLRLLNGMDVHHPVFVTTWLGYGTNKARERYVDAMIGDYIKQHGDPLLSSASSSSSNNQETPLTTVDDPCLPKNLLLTEKPTHKSYISKGTGNFTQCMQQSAPLLNKNQDCKDFPCLMGVHVPPIDFNINHFIGISEYWYSTNDLWKLGGIYDFLSFEKSALEYCARDWRNIVDDLRHSGGSGGQGGAKAPDLHRLEMQCFKAAWIINVLHEGIGIPRLKIDKGGENLSSPSSSSNGTEEAIQKANEKGFIETESSAQSPPPSFQSVNEINDVAVSWTLGRMVLEVTDSIPKSSKSLDHDHDDDAGTPLFEWKHTQDHHNNKSWKQSLNGYYQSSMHQKTASTAAVIMLLALAIFVYWCFCSPSSSRRRAAWFKRGPLRPQREEYGLLSMEEGASAGSATADLDNDDASSPRKTSNPISRTLLPIRILASRILPHYSASTSTSSSIIPRLQRSSSSPFLPLNTRSTSSNNGPSIRLNNHDKLRNNNQQQHKNHYSSTNKHSSSNNHSNSNSNSRSDNKLKHSASSPNLKTSFPQFSSSSAFMAGSSKQAWSTTSSPGSSMHIDLPALQTLRCEEMNDTSAPLTPPARTNSPGWALRMTPASTPSSSSSARSQSAAARAAVHRSNTTSNSSSSATITTLKDDTASDGYLDVPLGVSSSAPNVGANAQNWDFNAAFNLNGSAGGVVGGGDHPIHAITGVLTPDEDRLSLRSRQNSFTNLSLARNRGGHSRQFSTDVH